jgi:drug/metabolite transporter (DMT)-like permease
VTHVYVLGLLAAFAYALGNVLQQKGTLETKAPEGDPRFLAEILRKPVWLLGMIMSIVGWVLQAAALKDGSLAVVQSLCALSLVIALPLGVRLTQQTVGRRSIVGAIVTLVGITVFNVVGQPQGGIDNPSARAWWISGVIVGVMVVPLVLVGRRRRGASAAALLALAAGLCFAYQAAVTKVFVDVVPDGFSAIVSSWSTWVVIISAIVGFGLQQASLKTGYLAPSMASVNSATLVGSMLLAVIVFEETLSKGGGRLPPALIGLVVAVIGVVMLATPEGTRKEAATT